MRARRALWDGFVRILLASMCLATPIHSLAADLEVHFISAGQADSILVKCPDQRSHLLIDSGDTRYPDSKAQVEAYLKREVRDKGGKIDVAITSHAHADHLALMEKVLEEYRPGTYVDNGDKAETTVWSKTNKKRAQLVKKGKLKYINGKKAPRAEIAFCKSEGVRVEILTPWADKDAKLTHPNDRSVIVRIDHGSVSFLFVGDAEEHAEEAMLRMDESDRKKLDVDVLKVGHHGSDTSSTAKFIAAVSPEVAIISVGERDVSTNRGYKHPRFSTVNAYVTFFANADKNRSTKKHSDNGKIWAYDKPREKWRQHPRPLGLWVTNVDGSVVVKSNGSRVEVETTN